MGFTFSCGRKNAQKGTGFGAVEAKQEKVGTARERDNIEFFRVDREARMVGLVEFAGSLQYWGREIIALRRGGR